MKKIPRYLYNTLRTIIVIALVAVVALYAVPYVLLQLPSVQERIKGEGEQWLSEYLGTDVSIDRVGITPFNQVDLHGVNIPDQQGDSLLHVEHLGAGIRLGKLLTERRVVLSFGEIVGLRGHITRASKDSPTNVQFILDALKPRSKKPSRPYDVELQHVVIRRSALTYDVLDEPHKPAGQLDANHLSLSDLRANIEVPHISNDHYEFVVKSLKAREGSGLTLKDLAARVDLGPTSADVSNIKVELPNSRLLVSDQHIDYDSLKHIGTAIKQTPLRVSITDSHLTPSDLQAVVPALKPFNETLELNTTVRRNGDRIEVPHLLVSEANGSLQVEASGVVDGISHPKQAQVNLPHLAVRGNGSDIVNKIGRVATLSPQVQRVLNTAGDLRVEGSVAGTPQSLQASVDMQTSAGSASVDGHYTDTGGSRHITGHVSTPDLALGRLLDRENVVGNVGADGDVDVTLTGNKLTQGAFKGHVAHIDLKGKRYQNIDADVTTDGQTIAGVVDIDDAAGRVSVDGTVNLAGSESTAEVQVNAQNVDLARLGLAGKLPEGKLSGNVSTMLSGNNLDNVAGQVLLNDVDYETTDGRKFHLDELAVATDNSGGTQSIDINSDYINGSISGNYNFKTLVPTVKHILSHAFPKLMDRHLTSHQAGDLANNLRFSLEVEPDEDLQDLLKLPVKLVYKATVDGYLNENDNTMGVTVDAPYLLQGNKLIEGTHLTVGTDSTNGAVALLAHALYPAKHGKIDMKVTAVGDNDKVDSHVAWRVDRKEDFHGDLIMAAELGRNSEHGITADIDVKPSELVFNGSAWALEPGKINVDGSTITVDNLVGKHEKQYISINGRASRDPNDQILVDLNDVSLDYVFETLNINHVDFGGQATGDFYAADLLSGKPRLYTTGLHVDGLSYNGAVMGDADILSQWDNATKGISLNADIAQANGRHSLVDGDIVIGSDSLYIDFQADRANVAFLTPFVSAFASDLSGEVSGHAILLGNFHNITAYGDVVADTLRFKLDYTNTYYTAGGDTVHMGPSRIDIKDVKLYDRAGHTALLNGWLTHHYFGDPVFNFGITQAVNLLCYDTNASINPNWYGEIYGNGAAFITGRPGLVDIKVNMQSAPGSKFTFVLDGTEQAVEYDFITFRDRDKLNAPVDTVEAEDDGSGLPAIVRRLTQREQEKHQDTPTAYNIDLQGDITPDAQLVVVMDPNEADQIRCTGHGNLRLTYNNNGELAMFGTYTLDRGRYNFTLQDVIIKDFTISEGSSITFQGDPYNAVLDLRAVYALQANIKDLDESFKDDAEFNHTTVPVHAILKAKGVISEPAVSFDLEFPTLTTEAVRKIKSVVSTDDMMNQQILYLLALNRFYTPEYMSSTSSGNELTSVASSTISSQLSNILGKMSDKLSISPNFRSDYSDFSDMEVDVALSSHLLNDRLLINGNLGYRENTYNTSNTKFIGDFDIEYLLNSRGTLRLKAYNRFNDQNYYQREALTTQGLGIVWKHDFDNPFRRKSTLRVDTTTATPVDSIPRRSTASDSTATATVAATPSVPVDSPSQAASVRQPVISFRSKNAARRDDENQAPTQQ